MRRGSLATRLALTMAAVAAVTALLAALLLVPLLAGARDEAVREPLARQADLLATLSRPAIAAERAAGTSGLSLGRVTQRRVVGAARALSGAEVARLRAGEDVSTSGRLRGRRVLVEARPARAGGAVVVAAEASTGDAPLGGVRRRVLLALLIGALAAVAVAVVVGRRMARPLRDTAEAAARLATGERGVPVPDDAPGEVGEVARALAHLDAALARSEERQRRFLLSVSHELRTPLTSVRGYAEGLADGTLPPDEAPAAGRTIAAEAVRLEGYVGDLLALARLEADDFEVGRERVDLAGVLDAAATAWEPRARSRGVALVRDGDVGTVLADAGRLRQVLDALLDNALRVTPSDGRVVLAVDANGVVAVRDSGPGLTEDDAAVAFVPAALHERHPDRAGGHGVGLALAHRLVERMGGRLEVGRAPEGGSAFAIVLPRAG